jgi:hypothetical protein
MELFQPNNLSRVRSEFIPVQDLNLYGELSGALNSCYDLTDLSSFRVSSFVGANVSSQNFLVEIESKRYFLKWRRAEVQNGLEHEANLAAGLTKMGSKVPRVICTKVGNHVCSWKESCCALYVFEEGDYYTGQGKELDSAAAAFGELTAATARLLGQPTELSKVEPSFLEQLGTLLKEGIINTDPAIASLCQEHHRMMLKQLQEVHAKRAWVESQFLPMHLDYHPLNLLMRDGEVACILDLEHLKLYPVLAGLGFAGYKLIRQAMVNEQIRAIEFANPSLFTRWREGWAKSFPHIQFSPTELLVGARYRVLSLIHFILGAWLRRGDDRFNYDLAKQIGSLYEIEAIAARY